MPSASRTPRVTRSRRLPTQLAQETTLHALNNYLGIIMGYVELMLEELPADDPRRGDLEHVQRAAQAAAALLES